jgi:hypothetical protein
MAAPQGGMTGGRPAAMVEIMNRQRMVDQRMDMMQNQAAMEETRMIRDRRHDHRKMK